MCAVQNHNILKFVHLNQGSLGNIWIEKNGGNVREIEEKYGRQKKKFQGEFFSIYLHIHLIEHFQTKCYNILSSPRFFFPFLQLSLIHTQLKKKLKKPFKLLRRNHFHCLLANISCFPRICASLVLVPFINRNRMT